MKTLIAAAAALALASAGAAQAQSADHGQHHGGQGGDHAQHQGHGGHGAQGGHGAPGGHGAQGGHGQHHGAMVKTTPADGAMTHGSPASFDLTFHHAVKLTALTIKDAGGKAVALPALPTDASATFSVKLPTLAAGSYTAEWTADGGMGHTMSGKTGFMVH